MGWRIPKVTTEGKIAYIGHALPSHKIKLFDDCLIINDESIKLADIKAVYFNPSRIGDVGFNIQYRPLLRITLKNGRKFEYEGWKYRQQGEYLKIAQFLTDLIQ
jgi:hypothetical protein